MAEMGSGRPGTVRNPRAYLVRVTTRQALMRLHSLRRRKESYVGSWLPEPLPPTFDVVEDVKLAEGVAMAMLLVMEMLTPTERAVFVHREVFGLEYEEVVQAVGRIAVATRRIAQRTPRTHVSARRPREAVSQIENCAAFRVPARTSPGLSRLSPPKLAATPPSSSAFPGQLAGFPGLRSASRAGFQQAVRDGGALAPLGDARTSVLLHLHRTGRRPRRTGSRIHRRRRAASSISGPSRRKLRSCPHHSG